MKKSLRFSRQEMQEKLPDLFAKWQEATSGLGLYGEAQEFEISRSEDEMGIIQVFACTGKDLWSTTFIDVD